MGFSSFAEEVQGWLTSACHGTFQGEDVVFSPPFLMSSFTAYFAF